MKKRFIAGVKCPKCDALDRIVMLTTNESEWIECIECGHSENRPTKEDIQQLTPPVVDEVGVIQFRPKKA
ncbi:MAG: YheV family putative zinc ribbon protein [Acinetobacter sp.]